jgi:DNA mismatch repair protein MutL
MPEAAGELDTAFRGLAARAACAAAVKARSRLDVSEVRELLQRLSNLENPTHCPHGRPLLVRLSRARVEGLFHRR